MIPFTREPLRRLPTTSLALVREESMLTAPRNTLRIAWRWLRVAAPVALVLPVILACPTRPLEKPLPSAIREQPDYFPLAPEKDVDLLFVIDNSNSMERNQANLARNFPKLIDGLRTSKLGGAIPNVHIGVVSSDLGAGNYSLPSCEVVNGDGGRLQNRPRRPGCVPPRDPWISYVDGQTNVPSATKDPVEQVKEAFQCIAELGVGGCGFEHQLEAARRALDPATNPGFVRRDALLAIVIITDEDDCSAARPELFDPAQQGLNDPLGPLTSFRCTELGVECDQKGRQPGPRTNCRPAYDWLRKVQTYVDDFKALKPGRTMLFVIAGPTEPFAIGQEGPNPILKASCQSADGGAAPAVRLKAVADGLGKDGHFNPAGVSICSSDFGPAMQAIGDKIVSKIASCLSAPPLTTTSTVACAAGDQLSPVATCEKTCLDEADCVVEEVADTSTGSGEVVAKCPTALFDPQVHDCGASCPCWRVVPRPDDCPPAKMGSPYRFEILRQGATEPPKGSIAQVRCAASPAPWGSEAFAALPRCR
jgi:hypothetical protein